MTPAQKLAKSKPKKPPYHSKVVFDCKLLELRNSLKLTLRDVGSHCGCSYMTICFVEQGRNLSLKTALNIAEFFGKSIEEIWTRKEES